MRPLLLIAAVIVATLPLAAAQGRQGGGRGLGALGQAVRRPPPPTGAVPRLPDGTVDLNGVWIGGGSVQDLERDGGLKQGEIVSLLLPEAKKIFDARKEADDPHYYCMPMGVPRSTPYPFRIVQNYTHRQASHLFMLHEGNIHSYRQIFMDGRTHPPDVEPSWFGHSVGRWEGDTLVIDTVGFNDKFWFDHRGFPHTERLHTVERWTRTSLGTLENRVTIEDPGAYSRPFTVTFTARLSNPGDELMEYICQENNQFGIAGGHSNPFATTP